MPGESSAETVGPCSPVVIPPQKAGALSGDPDELLWYLLARTRDAVYRLRQKELAQHGLTAEQSAVLHSVEHLGDKATPAEIARLLLREAHSVSEIVQRMEKDELVTKVRDLERKNRVRVVITAKGWESLRLSRRKTCLHTIMSDLTEEQRRVLINTLGHLRQRALQELGVADVPVSLK